VAQRSGEGAAMKIEVDFGLCEANAICMGIIPEVFQVDEQDYLHVLSDVVTPENEAQIRDAVRQCPRQAISIVE
jgi:ferredoxin